MDDQKCYVAKKNWEKNGALGKISVLKGTALLWYLEEFPWMELLKNSGYYSSSMMNSDHNKKYLK